MFLEENGNHSKLNNPDVEGNCRGLFLEFQIYNIFGMFASDLANCQI